jgi:hypothetical protein
MILLRLTAALEGTFNGGRQMIVYYAKVVVRANVQTNATLQNHHEVGFDVQAEADRL